MDIEWADVLRASLSFFLIIVGVGIAYACFRLGGMFGRMTVSVREVTDEVVPILTRAQTTVDGINLELERVDEIMVTAVHATKGAEKTVTSLSNAVTAPVRKTSGLAAALKEAMATFRARRAEADGSVPASEPAPEPAPASTAPPPPSPPAPEPAAEESVYANGAAPAGASGRRGPSMSQIAWALPKRRTQ